MSTIEEILALDDAHREHVKIPEWGDIEVLVVSMTAEERAEIEKRWTQKAKAQADPAGFRVDVLLQCLKKADGSPLGTPEQIRALMGKNARAIERLFDAALRVSAFTSDDVQELEKN